ncbi:MAG TPA: GTPase, partial [Nitrosopumilaceae archaeon]|nr:GTPase [Nitrosopumilaceae archaeon]
TVNVLTKSDLIGEKLKDVLSWSSNLRILEEAVAKEADGDTYSLITNVLRGLNLSGFAQGLIPISNVTGEGIVNLEIALSRAINLGEEVED